MDETYLSSLKLGQTTYPIRDDSAIKKDSVQSVSPISQPLNTTVEELAIAYNTLLTALKGE